MKKFQLLFPGGWKREVKVCQKPRGSSSSRASARQGLKGCCSTCCRGGVIVLAIAIVDRNTENTEAKQSSDVGSWKRPFLLKAG